VQGEQILIETESGLRFVGETNMLGVTTIYLPSQNAYSISTSTQEHFHDFYYHLPLNGRTTLKYYHVAKSSLQLEKEILEKVLALKAADKTRAERSERNGSCLIQLKELHLLW